MKDLMEIWKSDGRDAESFIRDMFSKYNLSMDKSPEQAFADKIIELSVG